jgi:hypothetical protein
MAQDPWGSRLRLRSRCGCADGPPLRAGRLQLFGPDIALPANSEIQTVLDKRAIRVLPPQRLESAHAAAPAGLEWRRSRKHTCHRALLLVSPLHAAGAQGFCDPWANSHEAGIPTASLQFAHDGCMCRSVQG